MTFFLILIGLNSVAHPQNGTISFNKKYSKNISRLCKHGVTKENFKKYFKRKDVYILSAAPTYLTLTRQ